MDKLYEYMRRQLNFAPTELRRYVYERINWDSRMLGLVGPRGVGKTTLFLQRILDNHSLDDTLYITADHLYFANHTLLDTAEVFYKYGGKHLFIDEVHKYDGWSRELKVIYDSFPGLQVLFTGSSILDIEKGEADLSRRAPVYHMQGLSFREFLKIRHDIDIPVCTLDDVLDNHVILPGIEHPLVFFKEYLANGYYPFGAEPDFELRLEQVVIRTLETDIPQFANMTAATGKKLLRLMAIVSTIAPFKPNMTKLGSQIGASRNNVEEYLVFMEKAGMISQLRTGAAGLGALGKVEKVYLDNTNILQVLGGDSADVGTMRETFFFNQMRVDRDVRSSPISDFEVDGITFEVGGRNKGTNQLSRAERGYVVADTIEYGHGRTVPLWSFGLLY